MGSKTRITSIAAGLAASAALFAVPAQAARTAISVSIGAPAYVYTQPAYVYSQPAYVYSPYVYAQPSYVYTQPAYVYTQPGYVYSQPSYIYYNNHRHHHRHHLRDRDRDGVPDRFDRRPNNPYRY